jgi:hypothetical protein
MEKKRSCATGAGDSCESYKLNGEDYGRGVKASIGTY